MPDSLEGAKDLRRRIMAHCRRSVNQSNGYDDTRARNNIKWWLDNSKVHATAACTWPADPAASFYCVACQILNRCLGVWILVPHTGVWIASLSRRTPNSRGQTRTTGHVKDVIGWTTSDENAKVATHALRRNRRLIDSTALQLNVCRCGL